MKIVTKILDVVCLIFKWITAIILALMLIASVAEIIRRYIMGASFVWADEFIRYWCFQTCPPSSSGNLFAIRRLWSLPMCWAMT